jgi:hypothetical protein
MVDATISHLITCLSAFVDGKKKYGKGQATNQVNRPQTTKVRNILVISTKYID